MKVKMNKKIKYVHLIMNMIQTIIFVEYDIIWLYMLLQIVMTFLLKTKNVLEMNMYLMFLFSTGVYGFLILYAFQLVSLDQNLLSVLFCSILTNFVLSLVFLDFTMEEPHFIYGECPICLENGMVIELRQCKHTFHLYCIETWFRRKKTCPLCRCHSNE